MVCVRIAQYHTVSWLVWANRHGQELRSGSDQVQTKVTQNDLLNARQCWHCFYISYLLHVQVTVHAVIYTCQLLCQELFTISGLLLRWGSNDPSIMGKHSPYCNSK